MASNSDDIHAVLRLIGETECRIVEQRARIDELEAAGRSAEVARQHLMALVDTLDIRRQRLAYLQAMAGRPESHRR
jgi:hypothetical protein